MKAWRAELKVGERVIATVPYGRWSTIEKTNGGWCLVTTTDEKDARKNGWIHKDQVLVSPKWTAQQSKNYDRGDDLVAKHCRLIEEGKNTEALPLALEAVELFEKMLGNEHPVTALALNNLALLYESLGRYGDAELIFEKGLRARRKVLGDEHPETADSLDSLGWQYVLTAAYAKAEPLLCEALQIGQKVLGTEHAKCAGYLSSLASLYREMGDYAKAEPLFQQSIEIHKRVSGENDLRIVFSLTGLGMLYEHMGNYAKARPIYEQCLQIRKTVQGEEHHATAGAMINLAAVYVRMGDHASAEPLIQKALRILKKTLGDEHPDTALAINNLASLYSDLGNYDKAKPLFEQSLRIRKRALGDEHPDTAAGLSNVAEMYKQLGDYAKAEPLFQQSLEIYKKALGAEHPDTAAQINVVALFYLSRGDSSKADQLLQQCLQIRKLALGDEHPNTAESAFNLGYFYLSHGEYAKAEPLFQQSLRIERKVLGQSHPDIAKSLANLAILSASQGDWAKALDMFQESRRVTRRHTSRVLPALPGHEQMIFLKDQYNAAYALSLSLGYHRRADQHATAVSAGWLLNGKAIAEEALAEGALLSQAETAPLVRELRAVRSQLARLSTAVVGDGPHRDAQQEKIAALETRQQQLIGQLGAHGLGLHRQEPWASIGQLREELPENAAFVNIARFQVYDFPAKDKKGNWQAERYIAWLIPSPGRGEIQIIDLGEAKPIEEAVRNVRAAIKGTTARIKAEGEPQAEQELRDSLGILSRLILAPLEKKLQGVRKLILSPDGALWLVPWAALATRDGKYVVETYEICYTASGRELLYQLPPHSQIGGPVIMADPDFDLDPRLLGASPKDLVGIDSNTRSVALENGLRKVDRLPGTAQEAENIGAALATYAGAVPIVHTAADAQEGRFKQLHRPRVLVLSTHGFFLEDQEVEPRQPLLDQTDGGRITTHAKPLENPLLRCGLLLAGCNRRAESGRTNGDDGVLTGLEIIGTDLRGTELVVLSACDSGLGKVQNGEGVAGLRQAFQLAGAEAVVATLWQIPDIETSRLMNEFFQNLATGIDKAPALRKAQLVRIKALREHYGAANPFYWAAFTLSGVK